MSLPGTCDVDFPDPNDLMNFKLIVMPDEVQYLFAVHRALFAAAQIHV